MDPHIQEQLKSLPKMDALLSSDAADTWLAQVSRSRLTNALRQTLAEQREAIRSGALSNYDASQLWSRVASRISASQQRSLRRVINGTGIVLHTNLGRAPLSSSALDAICDVAAGYSNVEFDVETGKRGSRYAHVDDLFRQITGAESALVVNNNAAAVMLVVNTLARDGEVVTSRGELVEIGGSFRIPDVVERSEAELVEVGTTNKTRAQDFQNAITEKTRMLLKVHPSNYRVTGFTEETPREAFVAIANERKLWAVEDLGSGTLIDTEAIGLLHEPKPQEVLASGMHVVTFSGDKLLGGPQAGVIVGRKDAIDRMKKNPLLRALRMDKLTLAALEATLREYLDPEKAWQSIPVLAMLNADVQTLHSRANNLANALSAIDGVNAEVAESTSYSGGGALPDEAMPTFVVAVTQTGMSPDALAEALRHQPVPIVGRIHDDQFLLDARTLFDDDLYVVIETLRNLRA